jgi:hypothetical protein
MGLNGLLQGQFYLSYYIRREWPPGIGNKLKFWKSIIERHMGWFSNFGSGRGKNVSAENINHPTNQEFSLLPAAQTGSESQPASYPMGTAGFLPRGKAAEA